MQAGVQGDGGGRKRSDEAAAAATKGDNGEAAGVVWELIEVFETRRGPTDEGVPTKHGMMTRPDLGMMVVKHGWSQDSGDSLDKRRWNESKTVDQGKKIKN